MPSNPRIAKADELESEVNLCHYDGWVIGHDVYPDDSGLLTIRAINPQTVETASLLQAQVEANDAFTDVTVSEGKIYLYNVPERILMEVDPGTGESTKLPIPVGVNTNLRGDGWGILPDGTMLSGWEFSTNSGRRRADVIMRHDFSADPPTSTQWFHPAGNYGDLVFVAPNQVWGTLSGSQLVKWEVDPTTFDVVSFTNFGVPASPDGGFSAVVSWSAFFPNHLIGLEENNGSGDGEMRLIDISVDPPVASEAIDTPLEALQFFGAEKLTSSENLVCLTDLELLMSDTFEGSGEVGDTITYTFTITNTGETPLYDIALAGIDLDSDSIVYGDSNDSDDDGDIDSIAPGASITISGTYSITQSDIDSGTVTKSASVTGSDLSGQSITDLSDDPDDDTDTDTEDDGDPDDRTVLVLPKIAQLDPMPVLKNDSLGGIPFGSPATIDPLANDGEGVAPSSVRLIDIVTGQPSTNVETSEGNWTVDTVTGKVTFTPRPGFKGQTSPISYVASTTSGTPIPPATIQLEYEVPVLAFTGADSVELAFLALALMIMGAVIGMSSSSRRRAFDWARRPRIRQ